MSDASIPIPTAIAKWAKRAFDAEKERDRLRAEVERLTTHSGALESALFAKTSELYPDLRSELDRLRARVKELEAEREVRFGPHEQHHDINVLANLVRKNMALDQQQTFNALVDENIGLKARIRELLEVERKVGNTLDRVIFDQANSIAELLKRAEKAESELTVLKRDLIEAFGAPAIPKPAKFTNDLEGK